MNRDRDLEHTLERWLADGPRRMPDPFFDAVIERVDRTPQRRLAGLATRYLHMPSNLRLTAVAAAAVIALSAIALWAVVSPSRSNVGVRPDASTAPSHSTLPSPAASGRLIPDGTYTLAPLRVTDLIAMINADTKLSATEKTFLIDTAFAMKKGTTFTVSLELDRGRLTERQDVDGVAHIGTQGTYTLPDQHTLIYSEQGHESSPTTFRLSVTGTSFTLQIMNPPTKEVDALPGRVLFETGPFTLKP
jgi:hypothetical protein